MAGVKVPCRRVFRGESGPLRGEIVMTAVVLRPRPGISPQPRDEPMSLGISEIPASSAEVRAGSRDHAVQTRCAGGTAAENRPGTGRFAARASRRWLGTGRFAARAFRRVSGTAPVATTSRRWAPSDRESTASVSVDPLSGQLEDRGTRGRLRVSASAGAAGLYESLNSDQPRREWVLRVSHQYGLRSLSTAGSEPWMNGDRVARRPGQRSVSSSVAHDSMEAGARCNLDLLDGNVHFGSESLYRCVSIRTIEAPELIPDRAVGGRSDTKNGSPILTLCQRKRELVLLHPEVSVHPTAEQSVAFEWQKRVQHAFVALIDPVGTALVRLGPSRSTGSASKCEESGERYELFHRQRRVGTGALRPPHPSKKPCVRVSQHTAQAP